MADQDRLGWIRWPAGTSATAIGYGANRTTEQVDVSGLTGKVLAATPEAGEVLAPRGVVVIRRDAADR